MIDQVKRVRLSPGASPPGRKPRLTRTTGGRASTASASRTGPSPSLRQRLFSPTTTSRRRGGRRKELSRARLDEQRFGHHAKRQLDGERGVREQAARVAAARSLAGTSEEQRYLERGRRPGAELDRRPVVLGPDERHEHRPGASLVADNHRDVARRAREQLGDHRVTQKIRRRVDEHEVDVLLGSEADEVACRLGGDEARRSHPQTPPQERGALLAKRSVRRLKCVGGVDEAGEDQLFGRPARERLGQREERPEALLAPRRDEDRPLEATEVEFGTLLQDRPLEFLQRRARLEAELFDEGAPRVLVCIERIGLAARAVEREDQLPAEAFAERAPRRPVSPARHSLRVTAEREVGVDAPLEGSEPQLLDPPDRRLRERLVGEVGERRPSPERERFAQPLRDDRGRRSVGLLDELREMVEVELASLDAEQVARRLGFEPLPRRAERLPQLRDAHLQRGRAGGGRLVGPELVEQPVTRDDLVRVQKQQREQRPLTRPAERQRPPVDGDLQ